MSKKVIQIQQNKDIQNTLRNTVDSGMGKSLLEIHKQFTDTTTEDKYLTSAKSMLKYAKSVPQKNLSTLNIQPATRKTEIALILMPKWAVFFAPYNLARLAAVTRAAGYRTSVFDWNVTTWHKLKSVMAEDPYQGHGSRDYLWLDDVYESRLASFVEPILEEYETILCGWIMNIQLTQPFDYNRCVLPERPFTQGKKWFELAELWNEISKDWNDV